MLKTYRLLISLFTWREMDAVHNLEHAKTLIMIAHRLTTVKDCDTIVMLEGGRVIATGTYEELLDKSQEFRELANGEIAI